MAYHLFFRQEATCGSKANWKGPALGFTMDLEEWESLEITVPDMHPGIVRYLGKKVPWKTLDAGFGFNGCAIADKRVVSLDVLFPLHPLNVRNTMLTLSFVLQDIERRESVDDLMRYHLQLYVGCDNEIPVISGFVSERFKYGLGRLTQNELDQVTSDMRRAWRATAPKSLKRYADRCNAGVHDERFMLDCFGNACDVSIYPETDPDFSCHNLDTPNQQATLLAGLASLYERAKAKM
jgi:hypothetical protein